MIKVNYYRRTYLKKKVSSTRLKWMQEGRQQLYLPITFFPHRYVTATGAPPLSCPASAEATCRPPCTPAPTAFGSSSGQPGGGPVATTFPTPAARLGVWRGFFSIKLLRMHMEQIT